MEKVRRFDPKPKPGQVLLYVNLSLVESKTYRESLQVLEDLGYSYTLGFSENPDDTVNLYAILRDEPLLEGMPQDYMAIEWERVTEALLPDDIAVKNPRSLPRKAEK